MDWDEYIKWGEEVVRWGSNYRKNIRNFPVRSQNNPGDTYNLIPDSPPEKPEPIENIFDDFNNLIMPGITHWQHPRFFAYFPSWFTASGLASHVVPPYSTNSFRRS